MEGKRMEIEERLMKLRWKEGRRNKKVKKGKQDEEEKIDGQVNIEVYEEERKKKEVMKRY